VQALAAAGLRQLTPPQLDDMQRTLGNRRVGELLQRAHELAPPSVHALLRSSGEPLEPNTRALFESRFGQDLGHVRVHRDADAARSAEAVGADAYTVGHHVVFGSGRYDVASARGERLIAHELKHVAQARTLPRRFGRRPASRCPAPTTMRSARPRRCPGG
jgi:hypothetical protein